LNAQLKDRGLTLSLTDRAKAQVLEEGYDPDYGARPMKRVFQKRIQDKLAMELLRGGFKSSEIKLDYDPKAEQFTLSL
jgi:ATP-dependent Clp protease ATP-binding subunit ClpA